ncbi:hypothetical protein FQA39_LY18913 [Lamprigera yunnana]|nr:hypothetical protein FQA39_LY18913 [Lamprigera yunnana]
MKLLLCLLVAFAFEAKAQPAHSSMTAEFECLKELNLDLKKVLPYVHVPTDPADHEGVGEYLTCVWKKWLIIDDEGHVNGKNVAGYLLNIYGKLNLSEETKQKLQAETKLCETLSAEKQSTLGVLVKNCMFNARDKLGLSLKQ